MCTIIELTNDRDLAYAFLLFYIAILFIALLKIICTQSSMPAYPQDQGRGGLLHWIEAKQNIDIFMNVILCIINIFY